MANGEARLVRLNEHSTDLAPSPVMLVTRHHDRPGTVGRIGLILGEADVNISAMHLARIAARADALMILALDDDVPASGGRRDPGQRGRPRPVADPPGDRPLSERLVPAGLNATLVLLRHGESVAITQGLFQGQLDTPLSPLGERQAELAGDRLAHPDRPPRIAVPVGRADRDRPLAALPDGRDGCGRGRSPCGSVYGPTVARRRGPSRACSRSARVPGRASTGDEVEARYARRARGLAPDPDPVRRTRRRSCSTTSTGGSVRRWPRSSAGWSPPGRRGRRPDLGRRLSAARAAARRWSLLVGHDGVFKVALLALLDLPLERFWSFSFGLTGITIVGIHDGQARPPGTQPPRPPGALAGR